MFRTFSKPSVFLAAILAASASHAVLVTYASLSDFNAGATTAITDDFEVMSPKNTFLTSLTRNGITYTPYAGTPYFNVWVAGPGYTNFATSATTTSILTANGDEGWMMAFAGTSAIGFDTYLNTFGPATLLVYGSSGLLGTFTHNHNATQVGFWGITSDDEAITALKWTTVNGGLVNTGIDNIRMGTINPSTHPEAVPEPSGLVLLGLGLAATAWIGRKRAHRALHTN